ncbi:MAG: regulatory signaling modulator protein AmpE [Thiohalomonadales bacterium]
MSLITILVCLVIERFFGNLDYLRQFTWFDKYSDFIFEKLEAYSFRDGPLGLIIIVGGIAIPIWTVFYYALKDVEIVSLTGLVIAVITVLYCLGPKDPARQVNRYIDAMELPDNEAAALYAGKFLKTELNDNPAVVAQDIKLELFIAANDRIIGVLFWFVVLGPLGAVLFRMACLLKERENTIDTGYAKAAHDFYDIMVWPSARVCVLGFAISGSFIGALSHLNEWSALWKRNSNEVLVKSGLGALHDESFNQSFNADDKPDVNSVKEALLLIQRNYIALLAILAVLTISGWLA